MSKLVTRVTSCFCLVAGALAAGLLLPAARAATFDITFYGVLYPNPAVQTNLSDYPDIFTGSFEIADSALGIANNLILFRDPAFLNFTASFTTPVRTYVYDLHDPLIPAPGDPNILAQGIRLNAAGSPERFDTPLTSFGNGARFINHHFGPGFPSEMWFIDNDAPAYVLMPDGRILPGNHHLAAGAVGRFAGAWGFNGFSADDNLTYRGLYTITPADASPVPEPGAGFTLCIGLAGLLLWRRFQWRRGAVAPAIVLALLATAAAEAQFGRVLDKAKQTADKVNRQVTGQPGPPPTSNGRNPPAQAPQTPQNPSGPVPATAASAQPETKKPMGEYLPLTQWRSQLLVFRDNPKLLTDDLLLPNIIQHINAEATTWRSYENTGRTRFGQQTANTPAKVLLEWQKYIEQQPDLARGAVMELFLRGDADWSFAKLEKGWNDNPNTIVDVFLFAKQNVVDRDPQFAAQELMPIYRKHLDIAISKAHTKFVFEVGLPPAAYDFTTKSFRFAKGATAAPNVKHEFLEKINLLNPVDSGARLPDGARARSNYDSVSLRLAGEAESYRPAGTVGRAVPDMWRRNIAWKVAAALTVLSLDRPLQLSHFPLDAAKAEALTKMMASFSVRVYIDAERVIAYDSGYKGINSSALLTRLKKVEVIGPDQEVLATFGPEQLN